MHLEPTRVQVTVGMLYGFCKDSAISGTTLCWTLFNINFVIVVEYYIPEFVVFLAASSGPKVIKLLSQQYFEKTALRTAIFNCWQKGQPLIQVAIYYSVSLVMDCTKFAERNLGQNIQSLACIQIRRFFFCRNSYSVKVNSVE